MRGRVQVARCFCRSTACCKSTPQTHETRAFRRIETRILRPARRNAMNIRTRSFRFEISSSGQHRCTNCRPMVAEKIPCSNILGTTKIIILRLKKQIRDMETHQALVRKLSTEVGCRIGCSNRNGCSNSPLREPPSSLFHTRSYNEKTRKYVPRTQRDIDSDA